MANQFISLLKRNKQWIVISGLAGAGFYFVSNKIFPQDASVLQSSLGEGYIDVLGVTGDFKVFLLFVALGIILGMVIALSIGKK